MKKNMLTAVSLVIILAIMGFIFFNSKNVNNDPNIENNPIITDNGNNINKSIIFIPNDTAEYMIIDTIETDGTAKSLVENLIKSKDKRLGFVEGTELLDFKIENNIAYIDLNDLYYEPYNYGLSQGDSMYMRQVDSLVTSLFYNREFEIDEVIFLREGQVTESIGPLSAEVYNYYDFDYNFVLKSNKYYNGGGN